MSETNVNVDRGVRVQYRVLSTTPDAHAMRLAGKELVRLSAALADINTAPVWAVLDSSGGEVAHNITRADALNYLTEARCDRGWKAIVVLCMHKPDGCIAAI